MNSAPAHAHTARPLALLAALAWRARVEADRRLSPPPAFITAWRGRWHAYTDSRRRTLLFHTWSDETLRWALAESGARRR